MSSRRRKLKDPHDVGSYSSPKGGKRGCLCKDGKTYSSKCCKGELINQGIGSIEAPPLADTYLLQENRALILQEDNGKIIL